MTIALVAAVAQNGVIGRDNQLLWRLKSDLQHFRRLTTGKPVVMGRKTFQSIGRPLPNRENIVITRDKAFVADGIQVVADIAAALALAKDLAAAKDSDDIMVIGGGEIYAQTIDIAQRLHITEVKVSPEGDALFPHIDKSMWQETNRVAHASGPDDEVPFAFVDYIRR
jgi:dihydrofolate reductase